MFGTTGKKSIQVCENDLFSPPNTFLLLILTLQIEEKIKISSFRQSQVQQRYQYVPGVKI